MAMHKPITCWNDRRGAGNHEAVFTVKISSVSGSIPSSVIDMDNRTMINVMLTHFTPYELSPRGSYYEAAWVWVHSSAWDKHSQRSLTVVLMFLRRSPKLVGDIHVCGIVQQWQKCPAVRCALSFIIFYLYCFTIAVFLLNVYFACNLFISSFHNIIWQKTMSFLFYVQCLQTKYWCFVTCTLVLSNHLVTILTQ